MPEGSRRSVCEVSACTELWYLNGTSNLNGRAGRTVSAEVHVRLPYAVMLVRWVDNSAQRYVRVDYRR